MKVSLIGAGPGDIGLLTLRGKELLANADVVIYDALANPALLNFAKPDAELIYVGKIASSHAMSQDEINRLLVVKAREKGSVARLKGGDPYIFGRGGEEAEYLASNAIPFEEVPGVSSAVAAPAYAGIPLTHRDFVSAVMIITGHEKGDRQISGHDWQAFVKSNATLVFVMGMKNLDAICKNLLQAGMDHAMPAAVIYRGATPFQRCITASISELPATARKAGFSNPSVIVIGKVVNLREKLDWFSQRPLLGRTILVTRARAQASEIAQQLSALGAHVLECPGIEIKPLEDYSACDSAITRLGDYNWLIFTSVNGVKYFWQRLAFTSRDTRSLANCKIAAIGPATAHALQTMGVKPDLVPPVYVAEAVAKALIEAINGKMDGKRILIPRAAVARAALPDALAKAGAIVDIAPVYETVPACSNITEVKDSLEKGTLDCITFGSSSTVENLLRLLPADLIAKHPEVSLAAIGPITTATLAKHGLTADIQPAVFTIPALVEAIVEKFQEARK